MAIDKILFNDFTEDSMPVFRTYQWEQSFTYGISTHIDAIKDQEELQAYQNSYAKRMTGGGILFHGNDVSYALIIPSKFMGNLSVKKSYEQICKFLLNFYRNLGFEARYAKEDKAISITKSAFCQLGFEEYDILINGQKMGGNAQRRTRNTIFQHGSIGVKNLDNYTYTGNSLESIGLTLDFVDVEQRLIDSFEKTFHVVLQESTLTDNEQRALELLLTKEET